MHGAHSVTSSTMKLRLRQTNADNCFTFVPDKLNMALACSETVEQYKTLHSQRSHSGGEHDICSAGFGSLVPRLRNWLFPAVHDFDLRRRRPSASRAEHTLGRCRSDGCGG